jgi:hypothetical protein
MHDCRALALIVSLSSVPQAHAADAVARKAAAREDLRRNLQDPAGSSEALQSALARLAAPELRLRGEPLAKFAGALRAALAGHPVDAFALNWLVGDLDQALNPGPEGKTQIGGAVSDFSSALKKVHADPTAIAAVDSALRALVPIPAAPSKPEGPAHRYLFPIAEAPPYDRSIVVEDFETDGELWKTWYQPSWSTGVRAEIQTEHKATGARGLTLSHTGPSNKYTSVAKIPRPPHSIAGMNAIRMWIHPHAAGTKATGDEGGVTTGIIDGTDEIWQMNLPELFTHDEPMILEVRLADFKKTLRRNNGVIDLENRDFCFWMKGTYRFSVDDIRFVHDPTIPEFNPAPASKVVDAR